MRSIQYFALVAAAVLTLGTAHAAPAPASSASASPAAKVAKNAVATDNGQINSFSKNKSVTLKGTNGKKDRTYYINKSTVVSGTMAKGANAQVTYNPNVNKGDKVWAVKVKVTAAGK